MRLFSLFTERLLKFMSLLLVAVMGFASVPAHATIANEVIYIYQENPAESGDSHHVYFVCKSGAVWYVDLGTSGTILQNNVYLLLNKLEMTGCDEYTPENPEPDVADKSERLLGLLSDEYLDKALSLHQALGISAVEEVSEDIVEPGTSVSTTFAVFCLTAEKNGGYTTDQYVVRLSFNGESCNADPAAMAYFEYMNVLMDDWLLTDAG